MKGVMKAVAKDVDEYLARGPGTGTGPATLPAAPRGDCTGAGR